MPLPANTFWDTFEGLETCKQYQGDVLMNEKRCWLTEPERTATMQNSLEAKRAQAFTLSFSLSITLEQRQPGSHSAPRRHRHTNYPRADLVIEDFLSMILIPTDQSLLRLFRLSYRVFHYLVIFESQIPESMPPTCSLKSTISYSYP